MLAEDAEHEAGDEEDGAEDRRRARQRVRLAAPGHEADTPPPPPSPPSAPPSERCSRTTATSASTMIRWMTIKRRLVHGISVRSVAQTERPGRPRQGRRPRLARCRGVYTDRTARGKAMRRWRAAAEPASPRRERRGTVRPGRAHAVQARGDRPGNPSAFRLAPPTSAPSTSATAISSAGVGGLHRAAVEDAHARGVLADELRRLGADEPRAPRRRRPASASGRCRWPRPARRRSTRCRRRRALRQRAARAARPTTVERRAGLALGLASRRRRRWRRARPACAASALAFTTASLSPWSARRSEWPTMT